MIRIIRRSEHVWTPWKNGAGVITDIVAADGKTPGGDPDWRVSMAKVERVSPFSTFPGIERGMMLLEGERLDLLVGSQPALAVRKSGPAVTFPGDQPTRGVPVGGPILNLNVMVRHDRLRQRMIRWTCGSQTWVPGIAGGRSVLHIVKGKVALGRDATCEAGDTLVVDGGVQIDGAADLIEINIWPQ